MAQHNESVLLIPQVFASLRIDELYSRIEWRQNKIKIFGKEHPEPRLTAWFGPAYKYSNIQWPSLEVPEFLQQIADEVAQYSNFEFNAALLNYYRDGSDSMGWHSDDEPEIDQKCIASLSLGATRKFKVRSRSDHSNQREFLLEHGSLLVMNDFQRNWQHCVPKTKKVDAPRLNITFRRIIISN